MVSDPWNASVWETLIQSLFDFTLVFSCDSSMECVLKRTADVWLCMRATMQEGIKGIMETSA